MGNKNPFVMFLYYIIRKGIEFQKMVTEIVYPSSVTCEIVPEYEDDFESVSGGKTIDELVESEKLNILNDEKIGPMTAEVIDLEADLQLDGD